MSTITQLIEAVDHGLLAPGPGLDDLRAEAGRTATRAPFVGDDSDTLARTFEAIACLACQGQGFSAEQCDAFRVAGTLPHPPKMSRKAILEADVEECFARERDEIRANSRFER